MRWLFSAWLFLAAFGCEDDPDDLAFLRDAGTDAAAAPDAAADEDGAAAE